MSGQQAPSAAARHALETLDTTVKGAKAYEREDLADRLTRARRLLSESTITVHIVGEFKQGKSSLINALLTAPICPVDDDIATAVPTEVRYAAEVSASASFESAPGSGGPGWTEKISPSEIATYASEAGNPGNNRRLRTVTVGLDRPLLAGGLVLIDTPGVGGLGSVHNATTIGSLPQSHAVLFVTDASQELTYAELRFLRTVQELCPTVVLVLSKIDLYPHWKRIRDLNQGHLRRAGIEVDILPISSEVRSIAAKSADQAMNNESGFPALVQRLHDIVGNGERLALDSTITHVVRALDAMDVALKARRDALVDPENAAELVAALQATKQRADALRERSSKWQLVLQDGFADISSDVEFDLRARSRAVLHEAETAIDGGDPAKNWTEFEEWLRQRLAGEALENYAMFVRRAKEVAAAVGEHFELAEAEVVSTRDVAAPIEKLREFSVDSTFVEKKAKERAWRPCRRATVASSCSPSCPRCSGSRCRSRSVWSPGCSSAASGSRKTANGRSRSDAARPRPPCAASSTSSTSSSARTPGTRCGMCNANCAPRGRTGSASCSARPPTAWLPPSRPPRAARPTPAPGSASRPTSPPWPC